MDAEGQAAACTEPVTADTAAAAPTTAAGSAPAGATDVPIASEADLIAFTRLPLEQRTLSEPLRGVLAESALTGRIRYRWPLLVTLVDFVLEQVLTAYDAETRVEVGPPGPDSVSATIERFKQLLSAFNDAPWTFQRLCEILLEPKRQYSRLPKLVLAIEKCLMVTGEQPPTDPSQLPPAPLCSSLGAVNVDPPNPYKRGSHGGQGGHAGAGPSGSGADESGSAFTHSLLEVPGRHHGTRDPHHGNHTGTPEHIEEDHWPEGLPEGKGAYKGVAVGVGVGAAGLHGHAHGHGGLRAGAAGGPHTVLSPGGLGASPPGGGHGSPGGAGRDGGGPSVLDVTPVPLAISNHQPPHQAHPHAPLGGAQPGPSSGTAGDAGRAAGVAEAGPSGSPHRNGAPAAPHDPAAAAASPSKAGSNGQQAAAVEAHGGGGGSDGSSAVLLPAGTLGDGAAGAAGADGPSSGDGMHREGVVVFSGGAGGGAAEGATGGGGSRQDGSGCEGVQGHSSAAGVRGSAAGGMGPEADGDAMDLDAGSEAAGACSGAGSGLDGAGGQQREGCAAHAASAGADMVTSQG